jgi:hypothetical protein
MDNRDILVTNEIRLIKRDQVRYAVDPHNGNEARIVNLHAGHTVVDHKFTPLRVDPVTVWQERKQVLDQSSLAIGIRNS